MSDLFDPRIKTVVEEHRQARMSLDCILASNAAGLTPEEEFTQAIALVKAQARMTRAEREREALLKELSA